MKRYYFLLDQWYPRPTKRHLTPAVHRHGKEFSVSSTLGACALTGLTVSAVGGIAATSYVYHVLITCAILSAAAVDRRMAHTPESFGLHQWQFLEASYVASRASRTFWSSLSIRSILTDIYFLLLLLLLMNCTVEEMTIRQVFRIIAATRRFPLELMEYAFVHLQVLEPMESWRRLLHRFWCPPALQQLLLYGTTALAQCKTSVFPFCLTATMCVCALRDSRLRPFAELASLVRPTTRHT